MTRREANADLLAEITALRDRVASLTHENAELQGALAQASHREGATSEILRVISQSSADVQPVFDAIVENAARLCDGVFSTLISFDGELMRLEAATSTTSGLSSTTRILAAEPFIIAAPRRDDNTISGVHVKMSRRRMPSRGSEQQGYYVEME